MSVTLISWLAAFFFEVAAFSGFFFFFFFVGADTSRCLVLDQFRITYIRPYFRNQASAAPDQQKSGGIHFNARRDSNEPARPFLTIRSPLVIYRPN